jgi:periplasmic protein CpxP/Spy
MTTTLKRVGLGIAAALVSVGVYAGTQDQNTNQDQRPFMGGRGGPGRGGRLSPGGAGPMGMLPFFGRQLQLTDAQRDQVRTIAQSHRDEWKALFDRVRTARQALHEAMTADSVNDAAIREKSAEVAAVEADLAVARAHGHAEVLQILTAEQKAKLKELQARRHERAKRGPAGAPGRP